MRLLRRNLASSYAAYAVAVVSGLVTVPLIVGALGAEGYGTWAFIGSAVVFLGLLDFGVGPSVVRFAAEQRGRGAYGETSALAAVALAVYAAIAVLSLPFAAALTWLLPEALDLAPDAVWPARVATLLVVGTVLVRFPLGLGTNLLLAHQRWDVVNWANILATAAYTALVAGLLLEYRSIVVLGGIALGATVIRLALPLLWLRRELPDLRPRRSLVTRAGLRSLLGFSWHNFLIHLSSKVVFSADVVVVGAALGAVAAAQYGVPAKLFAVVFGAGTVATNLLYPALAELEGRSDEEAQRALTLRGLRVGTALMAVLALPLVAIPERLLVAWIGEEFATSAPVLALLGVALVLHQPAHVLTQYLVARGRQRAVALASVVVVAANLVASVALALTVGIWGVALATVVTEAVFVILVLPRLVRAAGGPTARELLAAGLRPLVVSVAAAGAVFAIGTIVFDPRSLLALGVFGAAWIAVGGGLAFQLGLDAKERRALATRLTTPEAPRMSETAADGLS